MSELMPSADERAELEALGSRVAAEITPMTGHELDRVRTRVVSDRSPARRPRRSLRAATAALLASGVLVGSAGAAMGVNAIAPTGDAARGAYPTAAGPPAPESRNPGNPGGGVLGEGLSGNSDVADNGAVQPSGPSSTARQLAAAGGSGGSLAFTGYLAIPALATGLLLVIAGLVMRRRGDGNPVFGS